MEEETLDGEIMENESLNIQSRQERPSVSSSFKCKTVETFDWAKKFLFEAMS